MKKVININFQGRVIPIEESAYDILKQYVESLRSFFANEEGRDEIINDIEGRIAELFGETLKKGSTCITDEDVNSVIRSIGRPEDFEDEETKVQSQLGTGSNKQKQQDYSSAQAENTTAGEKQHRLFRDENNKFLGGVCAGIANYFGIDKLIVRILFIIFAFGFGFGFIVYIVLWVAVPSTASVAIGSVRKRLFRDPDNKILAGVCSGLSNYFGVNIWIPRILFLIPFISFIFRWTHWGDIAFPNFLSLSFSPGTMLVYIILWLVIPEAATTSEKLEMKGEKVDINSIKNTIQQDMQGFGERAQEFGKEVGEKAKEISGNIAAQTKKVGSEAGNLARRSGSGFGDAIGLIVKIFAYFILGSILFAVVVSLFAVGIVLTGFLPLKEYIISNGWQNVFAWGTLVLFIWVPIVGIITWIIRRITKAKTNSKAIRFGFVSLWLLGLFCFIGLIASMREAFRYENNVTEQTVFLSNPKTDKLELKPAERKWYYAERHFLQFEPFANFDDDTVYVNNVWIRIVPSKSDSFQVTMAKMSSGSTKDEADMLASGINYDITQNDSDLVFDKGIKITNHNKFRNQAIYVTVAVPEGKRIQVDDDLAWSNHLNMSFGWDNDWDYRQDFFDEGQGWEANVEYIMENGKLKRTHPEPKNDDDNADDNTDINDSTDAKKQIQQIQQQKMELDKKQQDLEKSLKQDSSKYQYNPQPDQQQAPQKQPAKAAEIKAQIETSDPGIIATPSSLLLMKINS